MTLLGFEVVGSDDGLVALTDSNFDEFIGQHDIVVVAFISGWADAPVLDVLRQLASEQLGRLAIASINAEENMQTSRLYNVSQMPTLVVFRHGQPVNRINGEQPDKDTILREISAYV